MVQYRLCTCFLHKMNYPVQLRLNQRIAWRDAANVSVDQWYAKAQDIAVSDLGLYYGSSVTGKKCR